MDDKLETLAFGICNTDGIEGLSWAEVEQCQVSKGMSQGLKIWGGRAVRNGPKNLGGAVRTGPKSGGSYAPPAPPLGTCLNLTQVSRLTRLNSPNFQVELSSALRV